MRLDDESLDRAIAALPLEQPPPELRASILAATVYRPVPPFTLAEVVAAASIAGLLIWLGIAAAPWIGLALAAVAANATLLLWLAAGIGVTLWLELFTVYQPSYALARRAKGRAGP